MLPLTHAVELAWRIAAEEAVRTNRALIDPVNLLSGLAGVPDLLRQDSRRFDDAPSGLRDLVFSEWQAVAGAFERAGADAAVFAQAARESAQPAPRAPSSPSKISRSEATRQIFETADRMARHSGAPSLDLRWLFMALLESGDQTVRSITNGKGAAGALLRELRAARAIASIDPGRTLLSAHIDASLPRFSRLDLERESAKKLALLYELPLQLAADGDLSSLSKKIVEKMLEVTPAADHGALLVLDRRSDQLLLKCGLPADGQAVSLTLAERAMRGKEGFIWRRDASGTIPASLADHPSETGMYAPLLWQGQALGAVCVGTRRAAHVFPPDDLELLVAVAHYAGMAISNRRLEDDLRSESTLLRRMLPNFSPQVRTLLMERAGRGRLALGGERSEVTLLFSDIRGFTKLASSMAADDVGDMLNDIFRVLVEVLFRHHGTVDKFIGDAILAVFGSPEPDPDQHTHAVQAAWEMQAALRSLNEARSSRGQVTCQMGIAVHCGEVLHGFVGTRDCMEFTVVGDPVNRTARYCAAAEPGEVLISPELHERVWRSVEVEPCVIATKHEGDFRAFRLKRPKPGADA